MSGLTIFAIVMASVVGLALVAIAVYFIVVVSRGDQSNYEFIPQPFVEKNDFSYFKLSNDLQVLLVKPNQNLNMTYVGELKSSFGWGRLGIRS
jgi:hypothetical protein